MNHQDQLDHQTVRYGFRRRMHELAPIPFLI